ncbi:hypothetical protein JCM3774_000568 [Rhodotorula dairenensis]
MAKGLFAVYRDDTLGQPPAPASSASRGSSINKLAARRQGEGSGLNLPRRGLGLSEKENIDPLKPTSAGKGVLGKGKGLGKVAKSAPCRKTLAASPAAPNAVVRPLRRGGGNEAPTTNGICTGTLRTRVLPDLPPLLSSPGAEQLRSDQGAATEAAAARKPSVVELRFESTGSSPQSSGDRSYASATDSGYAQSPTASTRGTGPLDPETRKGNVFADDDVETESDMSLVMMEEEEKDEGLVDVEADRRARALTESPLAEITQAFTGLGGFSVANMSPTPATAGYPAARFSASVSARPPSSLRPPVSPTRKTFSGVRTGAGGVPAFLGTTKRLKPGQTVPSAPKTAPGRSMRL